METITAQSAQDTFPDLLRSAIREHKLYRIASAEGGAVLLSEEEYESLVETLYLLSTPGLYESIKTADKQIAENDTLSFDEVFGDE